VECAGGDVRPPLAVVLVLRYQSLLVDSAFLARKVT